MLLQEDGNAVSEATKSITNATQKVIDAKDSVVGFFGGEPEKKSEVVKCEWKISQQNFKIKSIKIIAVSSTGGVSKSSAVASPPLPSITAPEPQVKKTSSARQVEASKPSEAATPKAVEPKKVAGQAAAPSAPIKLPSPKVEPLPASLVDLEKALENAALTAVREYNNAIKHLKEYSEDVKKVVDRVIEHNDHSVWSLLKNKTSARDTAIESAERSAQDARAHIEKLEQHVVKVAKDASPDVVEATRRKIRAVSDQLNKTKDDLYAAKDSANLSEKYWKRVEEARNYFAEQVHELFPGIDLSAKKLNLSKEDIDLLILHAYSHVLAYQKELQKMHIEGETRLRRALDALKGADQTEAVQHQLEFLLEKEKQQLNLENQKKLLRIKVENEAKLRAQLKKQSEAHVDHLEDALNEKEKELRRVFNRELNEKLSVEQAAYKLQLATMLGKLRGMDSAMKGKFDPWLTNSCFPFAHTKFLLSLKNCSHKIESIRNREWIERFVNLINFK